MNLLDVLLLLLVFAYALSGYWQGFITGAFATAGLLAGGLVGIWLAPILLGEAAPTLLTSLGALFVVLLCASIGQAASQILGGRIRDRITWQPARAVDAIGGGALSTAAVLVVAWALGVALSGARLPWVTPAVNESAVLAKVNAVMPDVALRALNNFNDVVGSGFFPRYLEPFAPEQIVKVGPPPKGIARNPNVVQAGRSVLKVRGENDCGRGVEGTGFLYTPTRLMTNAHVVSGVDSPSVLIGDEEVPAKVVLYNRKLDVAVLALADTGLPALNFELEAEAGDPGAVLGYPEDGPYNVQGARIRGEQRLRSPDIYGNGTVIREVYSLRSRIRPGNSGGPIVSRQGEVLGVIFAASVNDRDTGYALTASQVQESAARGRQATAATDTGPCS